MSLPIVYHPDYIAPLRPGHRFPMSKYGYLRRALESRGLVAPGAFVAPAPASRGQIESAHSPSYVARVFDGRLSADEVRRIGLPQTHLVVRRARLSAAGTTLAAWLALEHGLACNAAGGSHHAAPDYGAGFCVFNDVAVAVHNLAAHGVTGPFLIIDTDVHQGDGTAEFFRDNRDVFTLSVHAERNFPARKGRSSLDVALPDRTDDQVYLRVLESALGQCFARVRPTLVFYNAGVDVHRDDKLGRLDLTSSGIRRRDACVINAARSRGIPLAGVIGGGYSDDPEALAERHAILFEEAARCSS